MSEHPPFAHAMASCLIQAGLLGGLRFRARLFWGRVAFVGPNFVVVVVVVAVSVAVAVAVAVVVVVVVVVVVKNPKVRTAARAAALAAVEVDCEQQSA